MTIVIKSMISVIAVPHLTIAVIMLLTPHRMSTHTYQRKADLIFVSFERQL